MPPIFYRAFAFLTSLAALWLVTRYLLPFLFQSGFVGEAFIYKVAAFGIVGAPIFGWVIVELVTGRVIWWPYPLTRRRDDPGEYWFSVGLKVALLAVIAVEVIRRF